MLKNLIHCIISLMSICLFSCNEHNSKNKKVLSSDSLEVMKTMNNTGIPIDTLFKRVLENGDIESYNYLQIEFLDCSDSIRIKWSKIMAEKHHFIPAYVDYFFFMTMKCNPASLSCLSKNERDTAILFLKCAVERGDSEAIELKKRFNIK